MNSRFRPLSPGYREANKSEIQAALTANPSAGKCEALYNNYYGDIIIVPTGVTGNLILQHGFYPTAYIRPETSTAVLNGIVADSGQFTRVQELIRQTCKTVIEFNNVEEFIEYVDTHQDF